MGRLWRVILYLVVFLAVMGSMAFLGPATRWCTYGWTHHH